MKKNYNDIEGEIPTMLRSKQNIVLISNGISDTHINTRSHFQNDLPPESLENKRWELGVDSFHLDNRFSYIPIEVIDLPHAIVFVREGERDRSLNITEEDYIHNSRQFYDLLLRNFFISEGTTGASGASIDFSMQGDIAKFIQLPDAPIHRIFMHRNIIDWLNIWSWVRKPHTTRNFKKIPFIEISNPFYISNTNGFAKQWPTSINISIDEIQPKINGHSYNKIVKTIPYQTDYKYQPTISHRFEEGEYFELSEASTKSFKVKLINEEGNLLRLVSGQPSVLVLNLREKMEKTFVITVNSKDDLVEFPANNNTSFRATLPHPISLNDSWEVALSSVRFSNHINYSAHIGEDFVMSLVDIVDVENPITYNIPFIYLRDAYTPEEIIELMDDRINDVLIEKGSNIRSHLRYQPKTRSITLELLAYNNQGILVPQQWAGVGLSNSLSEFFGNESRDVSANAELAFTTTYRGEKIGIGIMRDSTLIPQTLLVYTNLTKPIIVGGAYGPIIKVVPIKTPKENARPQDVTLFESKTLTYITAANIEVYTVDIDIRDIGGKPVEFHKDSTTSVNFIFRQIKT